MDLFFENNDFIFYSLGICGHFGLNFKTEKKKTKRDLFYRTRAAKPYIYPTRYRIFNSCMTKLMPTISITLKLLLLKRQGLVLLLVRRCSSLF